MAESRFGLIGQSWGAGGSFAVAGDSLIGTVDAYTGAIRIHAITGAGPRLVKAGSLPVQPHALTESDWRRAEGRAREKRTLPSKTHVAGPPFVARLGACLFDDAGRLWVRRMTYDAATQRLEQDSHYLVIPADDRPQRIVELPAGTNVLHIRGRHLLALRRGEFGTHSVDLLRLGDI